MEHLTHELLLWGGFNLFVVALLVIDLGVFHRHSHEVKVKEALTWTVVWITLAMIFNVVVYFWHGKQAALEFLAGYLLEKSLSVDNIFVFILLFSYFNVPAKYQHKILFWGILGALVMRGILIVVGAHLIHKFHWIIYIFGAFLILTGLKMLLKKDDEEVEPEKNPVVGLFKRIMPVTPEYHADKFFVKINARTFATPLLIVLIIVETTDLVFALDSIPAIFAVSHDPFIVYTSNVFAILGLRALYFALAGVMKLFRFLKVGLSFVLIFVGVKMLISEIYKIPIILSLGVIAGVIAVSMAASLLIKEKPAA